MKGEGWHASHLSSCAGHRQVAAVFAEVDLLDAKPRVVAVGVEAAHLGKQSNAIIQRLIQLKTFVFVQKKIVI